MKFYAVCFGNWQGISDEDVYEVFRNEEDAEKYCDKKNYDCSPDEWFEIREWNEKQVKKFWGDFEIS